jgi:hypothetical protein
MSKWPNRRTKALMAKPSRNQLYKQLDCDDEAVRPQLSKGQMAAYHANNAKLTREEDARKRLGYCPICRMAILPNGNCSMDPNHTRLAREVAAMREEASAGVDTEDQ